VLKIASTTITLQAAGQTFPYHQLLIKYRAPLFYSDIEVTGDNEVVQLFYIVKRLYCQR
jgi:hypothetical protein